MGFSSGCSVLVFFSSRRLHTRCALVTGVQTCAPPILSAFRKAALGCFARGFIHPPAQEGCPIMRRDGIERGHNIIEIIRRYAPIAITPAEKSLGKIVHALPPA